MTAAILSAADFTDLVSLNQCAFPTLFNGERWFSSPVDKWYLYCAPHDTPGGIYLATAPALSGPWTVQNGGSAVLPTPSPYRHVSSPHIVRDPLSGSIFLYAHMLNATGDDTQDTHLWTVDPTDGLSFTWANGQQPVIAHSTDGSDVDTGNAAYMHVTWTGDGWIGHYQGSPLVGGAHVVEAISEDGITWTKSAGIGGNKAWFDEAGLASQAPVSLVLNGRIVVVYASPWGSTTRTMPSRTRIRDADGTYSRPHLFPVQVTPSAWDAGAVTVQDFAYESGKLWCFYIGNASNANSNDGDAIGSASISVASNPLTFGDALGKS